MLGGWRNRATGRYQPPTKSVIHRVVMNADSEALEATLHRYAKARLPVPAEQTQWQALVADGKRTRGANRNVVRANLQQRGGPELGARGGR